MSETTDSITPGTFLNTLRQAFPQFAEVSRASGMKGLGASYAQQGTETLVSNAAYRSYHMCYRCGRVLGANDECSEGSAWTSRTFVRNIAKQEVR